MTLMGTLSCSAAILSGTMAVLDIQALAQVEDVEMQAQLDYDFALNECRAYVSHVGYIVSMRDGRIPFLVAIAAMREQTDDLKPDEKADLIDVTAWIYDNPMEPKSAIEVNYWQLCMMKRGF